ncbi:hypothetical protein [Mesotoga sp.]|uniref:hypothetical protein n=1 Tax=Mesotoga sp. TaxID=2053577 RepID=UPI00345E8D1E
MRFGVLSSINVLDPFGPYRAMKGTPIITDIHEYIPLDDYMAGVNQIPKKLRMAVRGVHFPVHFKALGWLDLHQRTFTREKSGHIWTYSFENWGII